MPSLLGCLTVGHPTPGVSLRDMGRGKSARGTGCVQVRQQSSKSRVLRPKVAQLPVILNAIEQLVASVAISYDPIAPFADRHTGIVK